MTPDDLLIELWRRGVRVEVDGGRLRYSPRSKMTPELVELLKTHKPDLLAILRPATKAASTMAETDLGDGWLDGSDELPDLEPCPKCSSLELWETSSWPRRWLCVHCSPPSTAMRLLEHVERIRQRSPRPTTNTFAKIAPPERWQASSTVESATTSGPERTNTAFPCPIAVWRESLRVDTI